MKSLLRIGKLCLLMVVATFALVACGSSVPAVESFETFKGFVQDGNYSQAHNMLSEESKSSLSQAELKTGCETTWSEIFQRGVVKNPQWVGEGENQSKGTIQLVNEDGNVTSQNAGEWIVVKVGEEWKVLWRLSESQATGVGGEDPTGNAVPSGE